MNSKNTDLISLFENALKDISDTHLEETGVTIRVGDGICQLQGLKNAIFGEQIRFAGGNSGIIFDLGQESVSIFLLYNTIKVSEGEIAYRTGSVFKIPVSNAMIGRVLDALCHPIDALGPIETKDMRAVEQPAANIIERSPINESLETGLMVIDALFPIGKGQRELIVGNRDTGKTSIGLNAILHQKGKNVLCLYVSIGQRKANLARIIQLLLENNALEYTAIISADASETVLKQYLAPYTACTLAEFYAQQGRDVLVIYDDLSNHATTFREMSLLLRRTPGREAYPGDIFYLHSRLLERAGKFLKGGSITALPIVQIQSDDITAYIPTNLISITDGQIFLDTKLFKKGQRPAVNVELSVSRVGGAAQTKVIKKMTRALRLELAQYIDLLDFSQFGTELDALSQKSLARGARIMAILKQKQFITYSFVEQALILFLVKENFLDKIALDSVEEFAIQFISYFKSVYRDLYDEIYTTQDMSDAVKDQIVIIATDFSKLFIDSKNKRTHVILL